MGVKHIKDMPGLVYQEDAWYTQFDEMFDLEVLLPYLRAFVGENGVRDRVHAPEKADRARSIRHHREYFGIQFFEGWVVMAQLHHMIDAVRSGKANIKHQQRVGLM